MTPSQANNKKFVFSYRFHLTISTFLMGLVCETRFYFPAAAWLLLCAHAYAYWRGYTRNISTWKIVVCWLGAAALSLETYATGVLGRRPEPLIFPDPEKPAELIALVSRATHDFLRIGLLLAFAWLLGRVFFPVQLSICQERLSAPLVRLKKLLHPEARESRQQLGRTVVFLILTAAASLVLRIFTKEWIFIIVGVFLASSVFNLFLKASSTPFWFRLVSLFTFSPIECFLLYRLLQAMRELSVESKNAGGLKPTDVFSSPLMSKVLILEALLIGFLFGFLKLRKYVTASYGKSRPASKEESLSAISVEQEKRTEATAFPLKNEETQ